MRVYVMFRRLVSLESGGQTFCPESGKAAFHKIVPRFYSGDARFATALKIAITQTGTEPVARLSEGGQTFCPESDNVAFHKIVPRFYSGDARFAAAL